MYWPLCILLRNGGQGVSFSVISIAPRFISAVKHRFRLMFVFVQSRSFSQFEYDDNYACWWADHSDEVVILDLEVLAQAGIQ